MGTHVLPAALFAASFMGAGLSCLFAWTWVSTLDRPRWHVLLLPFILALWAMLSGCAAKVAGLVDGWLGVAAPLLMFGYLVFEWRFVRKPPENIQRDQNFQGSSWNLVLGLVLCGVGAWAGSLIFTAV